MTKDANYSEMLIFYGFPPKVVWIRRGNCSTNNIETLLREHFEAIETLSDAPDIGVITIF